ncbi:MAG: asparaginase [Pseudomonadota bacterium]
MQISNPHKMVVLSRSGQDESSHYGWAVLIDSQAQIIQEWGDSNVPIFPRSALKPLQTLAVVASGAAKQLPLTHQQLALASASHEGEEIHLKPVVEWLKSMHLDESALACGPEWPKRSKERSDRILSGLASSPLLHNCSGKHCGQLSLCKHQKWPFENYNQLNHPAQQFFLEILSEVSTHTPLAIGVDGCTLPAPQMRLKDFAYALARLSDPQQMPSTVLAEASATILEATISNPDLTGGTRAPNSMITKAGNGDFFAKNGAEGVYGVISRKHKKALALKIADGADRAAICAISGLIKKIGWSDDPIIQNFSYQALLNSAKQPIGLMSCVI